MTLSELISDADRPSPELDRAICLWAYPWLANLPHSEFGGWICPKNGLIAPPQRYTESVDAAIALFRKVLPGWGFDLCSPSEENSGVFVCLYPPDVDAETVWSFDDDQPTHNHLALALCTAIAKAKGL